MDIKDVSNESKYIGYLKQLQGIAERAARRNAQALNENTIATTQVPAPYPPYIISANDLEPIMISDIRLETDHRGKKIMLHILTPPDRMTAMMVIMEDKKGIAMLLQLYHQPEETIIPATKILSANMVCILKEPFFKCATDGTYSLRVDHPSDIIQLDGADDRIPSHWRPSIVISDENSTDIQKQGNNAVQVKKWAEALRLLEHYISSATISRVSRYWKKLTQSFRKNKAASSEKDRINERLKEQRTGEYKFKQIYKQAEKSPPFINCATFPAPVEIRESPGRGKGLFTTKAVSAGDLLLCEKAFSYSFAGDEQSTKQTKILMNLATKRIVVGGQARLLTLIIQKLYHNSSLSAEFGDLHHADYQKATVLETDGTPIVDSFLVEKIASLTGFGAPRTSRESFLRATSSSRDITGDKDFKYTTSGIWLLASHINDSYISNCRRSFIGDMQIMRATRDLIADTKLFFYYRLPMPFESYQEAQKGFNN
ncbi:hypothetical protein FAVG1_08598 [Fusarium avenaceum]|nr:hypothetical protein FAVG1_08598 [Fusarium avenaceum]